VIAGDLHRDEPTLRLDLHARAFSDPAGRFERLSTELRWEEKQIQLFGKTLTSPRLSAWYGDPGVRYRYSGLALEAAGWTQELEDVRATAERLAGVEFNAVLCNLYRDEHDSMGLHADAEPELGPEPVIASASFGAVRRFTMRPRRPRDGAPFTLELPSGSLLVLSGPTQAHWRHGVPKERVPTGPRINLTFRRIVRSR
jgi:alkylated DNA repair dioxygenase AlkB